MKPHKINFGLIFLAIAVIFTIGLTVTDVMAQRQSVKQINSLNEAFLKDYLPIAVPPSTLQSETFIKKLPATVEEFRNIDSVKEELEKVKGILKKYFPSDEKYWIPFENNLSKQWYEYLFLVQMDASTYANKEFSLGDMNSYNDTQIFPEEASSRSYVMVNSTLMYGNIYIDYIGKYIKQNNQWFITSFGINLINNLRMG